MKNRHTVVLIAVVFTTLYCHSAFAQFSQQGPKLLAADAMVQPFEGNSVSISADGNTAIIGGLFDNVAVGAAWVWRRTGGVWAQEGTKLVGSGAVGGAEQGSSVALSADGNTAIVGGYRDNSDTGAAWVWTRSGSVWTQQGPKLVGSGTSGIALQGNSVSLSADGNTAIVGGGRDNNDAGAAWVWTRSGGVWTQQGVKLVGSNGSADARQGVSVSLSADGNTAIVGGNIDQSGHGAAWVWTRGNGVWTQQGSKLVGSGAVGSAHGGQGCSVSLSADGDTAVVGGDTDNEFAGAAWVWTRSGGVWTQQGPKLVGSGAVGDANQGVSVSLSADGNTTIVGGFADNSSAGAAWVWTRSGGVWTQQGPKLIGSGAVGNAGQGIAVSISGDSNTAILGGPTDHNLVGAAWVFAMAQADVSVTKSVAGGPPFPAGGNLNYTISIANSGPGAASSVVLSDVLPAGATLVSALSSQGSCGGTTTVTCSIGTLSNGGSATVSIQLSSPLQPGTVSNTATVSATQVDPNSTNNSSTAIITSIDPTLLPAASGWALIALASMLALLGTTKIR